MRGSAYLAVLLTIALAGCTAGNEKAAPSGSLAAPTDPSLLYVLGLVTDDESQPIAAASVGLRGTDLRATTGADGRFTLGPVEPGSYTLDVARFGFEPFARQVEVAADAPIDLTIQLVTMAEPVEVYYEVSSFTAFFECAVGTPAWVSACTYPYTAAYLTAQGAGVTPPVLPADLQRNEFRYNFTVGPQAVEVISEASWEAGSAAAENLFILLSCAAYDPVLDDCDGPTYAQATGPSPLRAPWKAQAVQDRPQWVMERVYLPGDLEPSVALSQRVDLWNTIFFNGEAPEGFSILAQA